MMDVLKTEALTKHFKESPCPAVDAVSLNVPKGKIMAVVGESGSGKTTFLRLVAGLEIPDSGTIEIGSTVVFNKNCCVPPERRGIGLVFQGNALFPHLTVAENIRYGLRGDSLSSAKKTALMLELVGLDGLEKRYPEELSGGQQQRVAIARSLAPEPALLLLDEPFSSLDATLKRQVRDDLATILRDAETTALFVTHDTRDAAAVADHVALIHKGKLLQTGTPSDIYANPKDVVAARLFGAINVVPESFFPQIDGLLLRPEDICISTARETPECREAVVERVVFAGDQHHVHLRCSDGGRETILVYVTRHQAVKEGQNVFISPKKSCP